MENSYPQYFSTTNYPPPSSSFYPSAPTISNKALLERNINNPSNHHNNHNHRHHQQNHLLHLLDNRQHFDNRNLKVKLEPTTTSTPLKIASQTLHENSLFKGHAYLNGPMVQRGGSGNNHGNGDLSIGCGGNDGDYGDDGQKGTRFLSTKAVSLLNKWFAENREYPYPDELTTDLLARDAGISSKQVKKWFANKRVRSQLCFKPIHRSRKKSFNLGMSNKTDIYKKSLLSPSHNKQRHHHHHHHQQQQHHHHNQHHHSAFHNNRFQMEAQKNATAATSASSASSVSSLNHPMSSSSSSSSTSLASRLHMPMGVASPAWPHQVSSAPSSSSLPCDVNKTNPFLANLLGRIQQQQQQQQQQNEHLNMKNTDQQSKQNMALLSSMASFYSPILMINKFMNSSVAAAAAAAAASAATNTESKLKTNEDAFEASNSVSLGSENEPHAHHNHRASLSSNSDEMNQHDSNSNHHEEFEDDNEDQEEEDDEQFEREKNAANAARHSALVNMLLMMKSQDQNFQHSQKMHSQAGVGELGSFMEHSGSSNNLSPTTFSSSSPSSTTSSSSSSSCCSSMPSSAGSATAGHGFFRSTSSISIDANNNDLSRKSATMDKRSSCEKKINFAIISTLVD